MPLKLISGDNYYKLDISFSCTLNELKSINNDLSCNMLATFVESDARNFTGIDPNIISLRHTLHIYKIAEEVYNQESWVNSILNCMKIYASFDDFIEIEVTTVNNYRFKNEED